MFRKVLFLAVSLALVGSTFGYADQKETLDVLGRVSSDLPKLWVQDGWSADAVRTQWSDGDLVLKQELTLHVLGDSSLQEMKVVKASDGDALGHWNVLRQGPAITFHSQEKNLGVVHPAGLPGRQGVLSEGLPRFEGLLSLDNLSEKAELSVDGATVVVDYPAGLSFRLTAEGSRLVGYEIRTPVKLHKYTYEYDGDRIAGVTAVLTNQGRETLTRVDFSNWRPTPVGTFGNEFDNGTVVEFCPPFGRSAIYCQTDKVDVQALLAKKLVIGEKVNCGAAAVEFLEIALGIDVDTSALSKASTVSMAAMQSVLPVSTVVTQSDLNELPCPAILYSPIENHFMGLVSLDGEKALVADLSARRFLREMPKIDLVRVVGSTPIAMVVGDDAVGRFAAIVNPQEIVGATPEPGYTCTELIQSHSIVYCDPPAPECGGSYTYYYERWGCEAGWIESCTEQSMARYARTRCLYDEALQDCNNDGIWYLPSIFACD